MGADGKQVIRYLRNAQLSYAPLRLSIVYSNGSDYVSMMCVVDSFEYYTDNARDYHYSVTFTEYRSVNREGVLLS